MSDLLDDLVAATKDTPVRHDEAGETRRRVLTAHKPTVVPFSTSRAGSGSGTSAGRRRWSPWVLPLVAAFVATGALAAGGLGERALAILTPSPPPGQAHGAEAPPSLSAKSHVAAAPSAEPTHEQEDTTAPALDATSPALAAPSASAPAGQLAPAPALARSGEQTPPTAASAIATATATTPVTPASAGHDPASTGATARSGEARSPGSTPTLATGGATPTAPSAAPTLDPADALYRAAHDRHFRGGDPSGAVAAWDAYLAAAPRGRFAPEARFNRAVALLRAGRRAEGLAALEPFARGSFGGYRQADAQKLLDAAQAP